MPGIIRRTSAALLTAAVTVASWSALADVRVWTDQQEIILKGTLRGVEVLPDTAEPAPLETLVPPPDESAPPLRTVRIASTRALYDAVAAAEPGDRIVLEPGIYVIDRNSVSLNRPGSAAHPIVITAERMNSAVVRMTGENGFHVRQPYWIVENLEIEGACIRDDTCEHAFHIVGAAHRTIVRHNRIIEFNAPIKGNGVNDKDGWLHPDHVLIESNDIYNSRIRDTANPVTGIDVVSGRGWIVRGNYIADFGKARGNDTSYAAFLKGASADGLFERNLVVCRQTHSGGQRVGLSFGGGGTNLGKFCSGSKCDREHYNGTMRNNIVLACNDVGIYLNKAEGSRIFNNMLYDTPGIDVRFGESTSDIRNNILSGAIRLRDGAAGDRRNNVIVATPVQFNTWFADPQHANFTLINRNFFVDKSEEVPGLEEDFCGNKRRVGPPDIGPIEFVESKSCDVAVRMKMDN